MSIYCISIKNILTKKQITCHLKVDNILEFLKSMFQYQPKDILFLYEFDNGETYITAHDSEDFVIEKIDYNNPDDMLALKYLELIYDIDYNDKEKRVKSIVNNVIKIAHDNKLDVNIDEEKLTEFVRNLDKDLDVSPNKKVIQGGGFLIWMFEKYMLPKMPSMVQTITTGLLETIDAILIIGTSIPGLQAIGVGFVLDIVSAVYCFLRFDVVGVIGSLVSLVPLLGDILGGGMRVIAKIFKYYGKFRRYRARRRSRPRID